MTLSWYFSPFVLINLNENICWTTPDDACTLSRINTLQL